MSERPRGMDICINMWYSITTLSPIIVIYRQVLPNHRKISIFEGRNMENCVTTLFLKNHQNADFW